MVKLICLEVKTKTKTKIFGKFVIKNLIKGEGITLGNVLRRTLLSNILGTSFIGIKISGINHEFESTSLFKEDIIEILLNTKQIVIKGVVKKSMIGKIDFQGPGIVNAGDIKMPLGLEIVDPTQYITTITSDKLIRFEFLIQSGFGYTLEKNFKKSKFLVIDAIYMPVYKVHYLVQEFLSKQLYKSENLIIEIETNGSKTPITTLYEAFKQLSSIFNLLQKVTLTKS